MNPSEASRETSRETARPPIDWDTRTKTLEQQLAAAQERADRASERARRKHDRARAIKSRLHILERKARTRTLIQIGGLFVRAAGGELTVPQADLIARRLTTTKLADGRTLMAALVAMAHKTKPAPTSAPEVSETTVTSPPSE